MDYYSVQIRDLIYKAGMLKVLHPVEQVNLRFINMQRCSTELEKRWFHKSYKRNVTLD